MSDDRKSLQRALEWFTSGLSIVSSAEPSAPGATDRVAAIIATGLLALPVESIEEGVDRALAVIGLFHEVDRAFYYRLDEARFTLCHEWHREGLRAMKQVPAYAELPLSILPPAFLERLRQGTPLRLPQARGFLAGPAETLVSPDGDRALLVVPACQGGTLLGLVGLAVRPPARADQGELMLQVIAQGIARLVERKRVECALRDSEARFRAMCEASPAGIFLSDARGACVYINPAAQLITGLTAETAAGHGWMNALHPDDRARVSAQWSSAVAGQRDYRTPVHRFVRKNGEARSVQVRAVPLASAAGDGGFLGVLEDITDRRQREQALHDDREYLRQELGHCEAFQEIVGQSAALRSVIDKVRIVAATSTTVLITGETGTGKELVARAIHEGSSRRDRLLVKVNCAAISAGLVESELFGHERGAFTGALQRRRGRFELAHEGTLFLDEVGELAPETQAKLLRVLQERELERVGGSETVRVDVRVVAATNRNLAEMVSAGRFREDLYYRLAVFPVALPPLRERIVDIPMLVQAFVRRFARQAGRRLDGVSPEVMERLLSYSWPGNVRELQNVIERAVILSEGERLELAALPELAPRPECPTVGEVERAYVERILRETGWVIEGDRGAAQRLGLHPNTLRSRLKRWGMARPEAPGP